MYTCIHSSIIYNIQNVETAKCPSVDEWIDKLCIHTVEYYSAIKMHEVLAWLVWLSGLSASLQTTGSLVRCPVRAHAWVAGQVPSKGCARGNNTLMFFSLSFSLPSPLSKNK